MATWRQALGIRHQNSIGRSQIDLLLSFAPPRASGAGGGRPVNLLILLNSPRTAQLCGYRAQLAAISDLPRHTSQRVRRSVVPSMASLKRTNPATPAQTQVDRRRRQVTARPAGAATDEKTQTADAPSRATSGDRAPTAAADAPYNSSNLQAAVQHNADKEKEKAVEANLWTRVSTPCQTWRRSRLLLPR